MNGDSAKIAIYDVRGIQEYIFRTNAVKEIVGGSKIVDNLIITEFENACKECKEINESEIILDWDKHDDYKFDTDLELDDPASVHELLEDPGKIGGHGHRVLFLHASHLHTKMLRLDDDHHT